MTRHTISLPDPMSQYIETQVSNGQYGNLSEYIRDLIRKDQEQKQVAIYELKKIINNAESSGISTLSMSEIKNRTKKKTGFMNLKFSKDAEKDLENIYRYSFEKFGEKQADNYYDELENTLHYLVTQPEIGRDFHIIKAGLKRYNYKSHAIYYYNNTNHILVLRILHQKMDPGRHLQQTK